MLEPNSSDEMSAPLPDLDFEKAFALVKFYEEAAGVVKSRTWTIAAWVLSIDAALLAFCYSLSKDDALLFAHHLSAVAACFAGLVLSAVLLLLLLDQGRHLQEYWRQQKRATGSNPDVYRIVHLREPPDMFVAADFAAGFPNFCVRLILLTLLFVGGFGTTMGLALRASAIDHSDATSSSAEISAARARTSRAVDSIGTVRERADNHHAGGRE